MRVPRRESGGLVVRDVISSPRRFLYRPDLSCYPWSVAYARARDWVGLGGWVFGDGLRVNLLRPI